MAGITLAQAEARLADYLAAESAVLSGQAYEISGRKMTRANLGEIQQGVALWDERAKNLGATASGGSRLARVAPGW